MESETQEKVYPMYPFLEFQNWTFLPTTQLLKNGPGKHFEFIKEFETRESDVLLCSTLKTGTHWMHEILSMLLSQTAEYNTLGPWWELNLECIKEFEMVEQMKQRVFSTHLPFSFLPKKHIEKGYKVVYLNRNPKDRYVSLYHFLQGKLGVPKWTWSEFFDNFILKDTFYTGWFHYTKEMTSAVGKGNIFPILYEDLLMEPKKNVTALAKFLDVPFSESFIDEVVEKCSFDNLKDNKLDSSKLVDPDRKSTLFRKGKIGDWKNNFTVSQNEIFDDLYEKEMKNIDVKFTFE